MRTRWVDRDVFNKIITLYGAEQFKGQEKLDESDPEVITFLAPPVKQPIEKARSEYPTFNEFAEALAEERAGDATKLTHFINAVDIARVKHGV